MSRGAPPVFAANWKMNHAPWAARRYLADFLPRCPERPDRTILFFPPAVSLEAVHGAVVSRGDVRTGAQNVYWEPEGAFTGEHSAAMLAAAGAEDVLVGHSERRHLFGESVEDTVRKCTAALARGLRVMLCVGETLDERRAGRAEDVVGAQLAPVLSAAGSTLAGRWMLAYEPVWAIGTGEVAAPDDAQQMHAAIRRLLADAAPTLANTPLLYGGSVKPDNVGALLACPDVDGVLVGGASLDPVAFAAICGGGA